MSDFAPRFGLALIVVAVAIAAIILSRRNYRKAAAFERNIDAFRLEFQRSIEESQAATIKSVAKTIRDSISLVIRPLDSTMRDLDARLTRLEQQQSDATSTDIGDDGILDAHLARLEQHANGAIRNLENRLAGLENHTEATTTQIAATQKQALEENERIAARLIGVEQKLGAVNEQLSSIAQTVDAAAFTDKESLTNLGDQQQSLTMLSEQLSAIKQTVEAATLSHQENLATLADQQQSMTALSDQLSSIKQTIDKPNIPEQDIKNSIDAVSSRVLHTQTCLDELLPRLVLGDKARQDQATLIGLLVKRIQKLNVKLSDITLRIGALEIRAPIKSPQLQAHHGATLENFDAAISGKNENHASKAADAEAATEARTEGQNGGVLEPPPKAEEPSNETTLETEGGSDNSRVDQHAT